MDQITQTRPYQVMECGPMEEWMSFRFTAPMLNNRSVPGKLFLREPLGLDGMEVSLNALPPGASMPFLHRHRQNEELYLFLGGEGDMQIDGDIIPVRTGTAIRIAPNPLRVWRNTGDTVLYYLVIQAVSGSMPTGTIEDGEPVMGPVNWPV